MSQSILQFLAELAIEPRRLAAFLRNPTAAAREAGLTEDEVELLTGDPAILRDVLWGRSLATRTRTSGR